jgi:hypothetical protein
MAKIKKLVTLVNSHSIVCKGPDRHKPMPREPALIEIMSDRSKEVTCRYICGRTCLAPSSYQRLDPRPVTEEDTSYYGECLWIRK